LIDSLKEVNSADKLHHTRSVAYTVELVLLNKQQISGGEADLHCYLKELLYVQSIKACCRIHGSAILGWGRGRMSDEANALGADFRG